MHFLLAPDKFKGSIDSISLCEIIHKEIDSFYPDASISSFPLSDGGDGFEQIIQYYFQTESIQVETSDPLGRPILAVYQFSASLHTAYIEMASASGLALLSQSELDIMRASTFGTGLMIKDAIDKGAKKIVLGIGGSATNDCGIGMAAVLGFRFYDHDGKIIFPSSEMFLSIDSILPPENNVLGDIEFIVASDVDNPLYGPQGAAYVYSQQKGATPDQVIKLDNGLKHLSEVFQKCFSKNVAETPGAGAAGGMGAGSLVFLQARLISGINYLIAAIGLEEQILNADIIITGEGGFDKQSFNGKVVGSLVSLASKHCKKIHVICGESKLTQHEFLSMGVSNVSSLISFASSKNEAISNPKKFIPMAVKNLLEVITDTNKI